MKRTLIIFGIALSLPAAAQQAYVDCIDREEPLRSSVWGVLAVNAKGDTLVKLNHLRKMVPASNLKLITTGTAVHLLGPDRRFETKIAYGGRIEAGALHGDVYIIGGADPTLAADDSIAADIDQVFAEWKYLLRKAGIERIRGRVIGDGRLIPGMQEAASWNYEDIGTYYGAGVSGLPFYENAQDFSARAGVSAGEPAQAAPIYPRTPWMTFRNRSTTGPAGTGDNLYLYTTDLAPYAEMRGTFAADRQPKKERCANKYAALTCAYYFTEYLRRTGVTVTGGYADIDPDGLIRRDFESSGDPALPREALTAVGSTFSPPLRKIIRETNYRSDNFYAETLFRMEGLSLTGSASYDSSAVAVLSVCRQLGLDCSSGIAIADGSGLSRSDCVSPDFMVRFLTAMRRSPAFDDYLASLPSPGSNGTMRMFLPHAPESVRSRIFLKSGSMGGVLCYSGYIFPADGSPDGLIAFSILTNNCAAPVQEVRHAVSGIVSALAGE